MDRSSDPSRSAMLTSRGLGYLDSAEVASLQYASPYGTINMSDMTKDEINLSIDTNVPFSVVLCGTQSASTSHSTNVLLENVLTPNPHVGLVPSSACGLVLHYAMALGGILSPSRAANLNLNADITVLVLPSALSAMRRAYSGLPRVQVEPLHFAGEDIKPEHIISLMSGDDELRNDFILKYLGDDFSYPNFRARSKGRSSTSPFELCIGLLDSCVEGSTTSNNVSSYFETRRLVIVDVSSPYVDPVSACGLFNIVLDMFMASSADRKVVVFDEAQEYLHALFAGLALRDSLLSVTRRQDTLKSSVIISTKEPDFIPRSFIDICSFFIIHRLSSPRWLKHLLSCVDIDMTQSEVLSKIISLEDEEGVLFTISKSGFTILIGRTSLGWTHHKVKARELTPKAASLNGYSNVSSTSQHRAQDAKPSVSVGTSSLPAHDSPGQIPSTSIPLSAELDPWNVDGPTSWGPSGDRETPSLSAGGSDGWRTPSSAASPSIPTTTSPPPTASSSIPPFLPPPAVRAQPTFGPLIQYLEQLRRQGHRECPVAHLPGVLPPWWLDQNPLEERIDEARALCLVRTREEGGSVWISPGRFAPLFEVLLGYRERGTRRVEWNAVVNGLKQRRAEEVQGAKKPAVIFKEAEKFGLITRGEDFITLKKI